MSRACQVIPDPDFDPAAAAAAGWTRGFAIRLTDGAIYRPLFCLPDRLAHDAAEALQENVCHAVLATVVVADFDIVTIEAAAEHLDSWGYFAYMRPVAE